MKYRSMAIHGPVDVLETDCVQYVAKIKPMFGEEKVAILITMTKEFAMDAEIDHLKFVKDQVLAFKERDLPNPPERKERIRRERHERMMHGKHGLKRPKQLSGGTNA